MKKSDRTHKLIENTMLTILNERELSQITINEICEQASITRSTFYNHYHDKYQILEGINAEICSQMNDHFEKRIHSKRIDKLLITLISHIDKDKFLLMIDIQDENVNLKRDLQNNIEKHFNVFLETLASKNNLSIPNIVFIKQLFSSSALVFIESSIRYGQTEENSIFLNTLNNMMLEHYNIKI